MTYILQEEKGERKHNVVIQRNGSAFGTAHTPHLCKGEKLFPSSCLQQLFDIVPLKLYIQTGEEAFLALNKKIARIDGICIRVLVNRTKQTHL